MMKDYANRTENTAKPRRKRILLTIFIIGLAMMIPVTMHYMKYQKTRQNKSQSIRITQTKHKTNDTQKEKNNNDFEFYTLLPKN